MGFDGAAFIERFNTVWNGHDVDGILAMMTDDVVFEASFGKEMWGTRVMGKPAVREFLLGMFAVVPTDGEDPTFRPVNASARSSPGLGWPHTVLVTTPGKLGLVAARVVTSSRPDGSTT